MLNSLAEHLLSCIMPGSSYLPSCRLRVYDGRREVVLAAEGQKALMGRGFRVNEERRHVSS